MIIPLFAKQKKAKVFLFFLISQSRSINLFLFASRHFFAALPNSAKYFLLTL